MTDFCIQIHTDRAPDLDLAAVRDACAVLAQDKCLVKCFTVIEKGCDDHFNIMFKTEQPRAFWDVLSMALFKCGTHGAALRNAAIIMCEGTRGWDDYRLLHHYDPAQPLDKCCHQ